jgi:hypothetical protein
MLPEPQYQLAGVVEPPIRAAITRDVANGSSVSTNRRSLWPGGIVITLDRSRCHLSAGHVGFAQLIVTRFCDRGPEVTGEMNGV